MVDLDPEVYSAGFVIHCNQTDQMTVGCVVEKSSSADNYRGEILGGLMVQLVLRVATPRKSLPYQAPLIHCDNNGVVMHGNEPSRSLKEKQAHADVLQMLKQHVHDNPFESKYKWVKAHQDDTLDWDNMTRLEQLNCRVDKLAKKTLIASVITQDYISS